MENRPDWDTLFMSMAMLFAMRSPDTSTHVGCLIADSHNNVMSLGYNGWPRGVATFASDDSRFQRPEKYLWMEHAERNAIYNACRNGTPLNQCTLYVTLFPCADCARAILQVGISRIVYHEASTQLMRQSSVNWHDSYDAAMQMFGEAGIELEPWNGQIFIPEGKVQGQFIHFC